jgi:hypothetical protein
MPGEMQYTFLVYTTVQGWTVSNPDGGPFPACEKVQPIEYIQFHLGGRASGKKKLSCSVHTARLPRLENPWEKYFRSTIGGRKKIVLFQKKIYMRCIVSASGGGGLKSLQPERCKPCGQACNFSCSV